MDMLYGLRLKLNPLNNPFNGLHWANKQDKARIDAGFVNDPGLLRNSSWWARTDLNRGPKDYESSALTN